MVVDTVPPPRPIVQHIVTVLCDKCGKEYEFTVSDKIGDIELLSLKETDHLLSTRCGGSLSVTKRIPFKQD